MTKSTRSPANLRTRVPASWVYPDAFKIVAQVRRAKVQHAQVENSANYDPTLAENNGNESVFVRADPLGEANPVFEMYNVDHIGVDSAVSA